MTTLKKEFDRLDRKETMENAAKAMKQKNTDCTAQYQIDDSSFHDESPQRLYNKGKSKSRSYRHALAPQTDTTTDDNTEKIQPKTLHNIYRVPISKEKDGSFLYNKTVRTTIPP